MLIHQEYVFLLWSVIIIHLVITILQNVWILVLLGLTLTPSQAIVLRFVLMVLMARITSVSLTALSPILPSPTLLNSAIPLVQTAPTHSMARVFPTAQTILTKMKWPISAVPHARLDFMVIRQATDASPLVLTTGIGRVRELTLDFVLPWMVDVILSLLISTPVIVWRTVQLAIGASLLKPTELIPLLATTPASLHALMECTATIMEQIKLESVTCLTIPQIKYHLQCLLTQFLEPLSQNARKRLCYILEIAIGRCVLPNVSHST